MYSTRPNLVLGFHGCDQIIVNDILLGKKELKKSENDYDWLGHGIYFWENDPERALNYAELLQKHPQRSKVKITKPAVIGAVIDLGYCFDLIDNRNLLILKEGYKLLIETLKEFKLELPENKAVGSNDDLLLRYLDCAVIETIHQFNKENKEREYDSVRGVFWEGSALYPNAGFKDKNHIQICVRNPNCIKGYFLPRSSTDEYPIP